MLKLKILFSIQFSLSLVTWGAILGWVLAPHLKKVPLREALIVLLVPHLFRHGGIFLIVPTVASPDMPLDFAVPTAIGDTLTQILAVICVAALRKGWPRALTLVWVFNVVAAADLLHGLFQAWRIGAVQFLNAAWAAPAIFVPLFLVSHVMILLLMLGYVKTAGGGAQS